MKTSRTTAFLILKAKVVATFLLRKYCANYLKLKHSHIQNYKTVRVATTKFVGKYNIFHVYRHWQWAEFRVVILHMA